MPFAQFGKFDLPTIDFQVFQLAVDRFREGNPSNPFSKINGMIDMSNEKTNLVGLGFFWDEKQPSYVKNGDYLVSHYKDPIVKQPG